MLSALLPLPVLAAVVIGVILSAAFIGGAVLTSNDSPDPTTIQRPVVAVSGSKAALARALIDSGKLRSLPSNPDHLFEIEAIASGMAPADGCDVDTRILAVLTLLIARFDSVGVSDLNRQCTGQNQEGAGTLSSHWINGGGNAVDLWSINGHALTGGDDYSLQVIALLDPVVPDGARVGQADCRGGTAYMHFTSFDDSCNHLHLDVAYAAGAGGLLADRVQ